MNRKKIKIKRIQPSAVLPTYAHDGDSGLDLVAATEATLNPGDRQLIGTGLILTIPESLEAQIRPRSGLALEHGVTVLNSPGTIDSGYRGELAILLINFGARPFEVIRGMKIAQLVFSRVVKVALEETAEVSDSSRGQGGFGSTGP